MEPERVRDCVAILVSIEDTAVEFRPPHSSSLRWHIAILSRGSSQQEVSSIPRFVSRNSHIGSP